MDPLFSIIHVTDTHLSEDVDVLTPFVDAINAETYHPRPDLIVFGGDNIQGNPNASAAGEREMPMLKERLDLLEVPYLVICHNHDTWGEPEKGTQFRKHIDDTLDHVIDLPHGFAAITVSGCVQEGDAWIEGLISRNAWLDEQLGLLKDRKVLLFSHMPLFPPRNPVPASRRSLMRDEHWEASNFGYRPEQSLETRRVIARHGNVIAHYSGHCHLHSITASEGTHYITTASLASQPWEYRHIEVHADRLDHRCIRPHTIDHWSQFWINCVDDRHPDVDLYHDGLPEERDFSLKL